MRSAVGKSRSNGEAYPADLMPLRFSFAISFAIVLIVLLGFALRLPLLARFPLREDEAIYGYWALHGLTVDPLFLHVWPDKPPIFLWLQGLAFMLWGHGPPTAEPAARLISIFASTLTIPVLAATARRWWGEKAALVTAALAALNPFAVSFAPTAFTDPLLVLAGSLALALAARRRWLWSGFWLGAAIMTKQQGVLFLPLVVGTGALAGRPRLKPPAALAGARGMRGMQNRLKPVEDRARPAAPNRFQPVSHSRSRGFQPPAALAGAAAGRPRLKSGATGMQNRLKPVEDRAHPAAPNRFQPVSHSRSRGFQPPAALAGAAAFLAGLALVILPVLYWDSRRWAVAPSPWDLGAANVGGVALADPAAWPARAIGWAQLGWWLLASPWAWGVYVLALISAAALSGRRRASAHDWLPALLLLAWTAGFLLLHIVTTVQVWDRYLLPLTIPLVLLGGWAAGEWTRVGRACSPTAVLPTAVSPTEGSRRAASPTYVGGGFVLALLLALALPPAWQASQGQLPVGGDHGDYTGLEAALEAVTPPVEGPRTLLFHRELGWHARFGLFDAVQSGAVELRYYPSSVYIADSATKSPHKERYVIIPDWRPLPDLPLQLAMRGLEAQEVLRAGHFTVYRIDERPTGDQSWRVCAPLR